MSVTYIDIETNGLLDSGDRIVCLGYCRDGEFGISHSKEITPKLTEINKDPVIIGHNIIGFDSPFIRKLHRWWDPPNVRDTLVLSRMLFPDLADSDWRRVRRKEFPVQLVGSHGLKAWGYRLGVNKGTFMEENMEDIYNIQYSEKLGRYCLRDVEITRKLYKLCRSMQPTRTSVLLEHHFAQIIQNQMERGIRFDTHAAEKLTAELQIERAKLIADLERIFRPNKKKLKTMTKVTPFNPGSRAQLVARLREQGWKPDKFTEAGNEVMDESVLSGLRGRYNGIELIERYFVVDKRLSQIAEGNKSWMNHVKDGRIHGYVNSCGAVTGRCTHSNPNLAQVPKADADTPYGPQCRALFIPDPGCVMLGVDAVALELRCLAHYMAEFDRGAYSKVVLSTEDIHSYHQKITGIETRSKTKNGFYAYIYGAGDENLGITIGETKNPRAAGREFRVRFNKALPALASLVNSVHGLVKSDKLFAIDGRKLSCRSQHAALNTLLQSAGAIIVKEATVRIDAAFRQVFKHHAPQQLLHIHDEIQFQARKEIAKEAASIAERCFTEAGESFGVKCRMDGSAKIGSNWKETH